MMPPELWGFSEGVQPRKLVDYFTKILKNQNDGVLASLILIALRAFSREAQSHAIQDFPRYYL
jgi:hypothetical protein